MLSHSVLWMNRAREKNPPHLGDLA